MRNLPGGGYTVLDDVFVKTVREGTITKYKLIVSDSKFSIDAPWTTRQTQMLDGFNGGGFSLRSTRFERDPNPLNRIFSGNEIIIDKMVKTYGDGAIDVMEVIK